MSDLVRKYEDLKRRAEINNNKRISAETKFKMAKERAEEVVAEIKAAGYDNPKELPAIHAKKELELREMLDKLEKDVVEQERILSTIGD